MKLADQLKDYFTSEVRTRGATYYYQQNVGIIKKTPYGLWANVEGGRLYNVSIELEDTDLYLACTCPFYEDRGEGCKHLWAAILAADHSGALSALQAKPYFEVVFEEYFDAEEEVLPLHQLVKPAKPKAPRKPSPPSWTRAFKKIQDIQQHRSYQPAAVWPAGRQLLYILDAPHSQARSNAVLELAFQEQKKDGTYGKPKFQAISSEVAQQIHSEADAPILAALYGPRSYQDYGYYQYGSSLFQLTTAQCRSILPLVGKTGRLFLRPSSIKDELRPLKWDEGPPWQFRVHIQPDGKEKNFLVSGWLHRGDEQHLLTEASFLLPSGVVVWPDRAALYEDGGAPAWLTTLQHEKNLKIPAAQKDEFLRDLYALPQLPPLEIPAEMQVSEVRVEPRPKIVIKPPTPHLGWQRKELNANLSFTYGDEEIAFKREGRGMYDATQSRVLVRNRAAELSAYAQLEQLGFRPTAHYRQHETDFELPPKKLAQATRALLESGWIVEAEGKFYRPAGDINIEVATGIDWFDLEGNVQFGDQTASLPRLLQAIKRGENTIKLDDGSFGMLPEEWLKKYGMLAGLGTSEEGKVRFSRIQAGLLDALLSSMPEVSFDEAYRQATEELRHFEGITPADPPAEFVGQLRGYQSEGLGWLFFLQRFGFGGCLADDMGLGKTVQVLALLAERRAVKERKSLAPTLIVVPKSLVFNWKQEAKHFAPKLRVLDHTGLGRQKSVEHFAEYDVIITTYGTLRRDVLLFKDLVFDYCILDEAQAVKNASTEQAKAVRLLRANHRLALSGTPVENHLGELWSLFEFLNPGMLGHASLFRLAGGAARNPDPETREILAKGLRPFILRRTKKEVAKDLPDKTEQTLYCDMEPEQQKLYDELRDHYRQSLLKTIDTQGLNRSKIQVLEALLRLRQAACHPGLLDKKKTADPSAKLEMLLPSLQEAWEGGQKTLVFSQFTSFLAIVGARLKKEGMSYAYLDGKTRNRAAIVEQFQNDPNCKLFLISLKAGGVGLNLTAAEYVFLLDPWWNPAVEAQAIDRTHRIGQTKPVFAYRLITRNTVEEKVLELQKTKRDLADAILNADNSLISTLKREDLEMLLS